MTKQIVPLEMPGPDPVMTTPISLRPGMLIPDGLVVQTTYNDATSRNIQVFNPTGNIVEMKVISDPVPVLPVSDHTWRSKILENSEAVIVTRRSGLSITLGADPEIFVVDATGAVLPAFKWLPPKQAPKKYEYGTVFYDGFQAEWTCGPYPGNMECLSYHADVVQHGLLAVRDAARAFDPAARLSIASAVPVPPEMAAAVDPRHMELGCSPSKNVYGEEPLRVDDPYELGFRSAGWHMHMGLKEGIPEPRIHDAIRMMDRVLGVAGVSFGQAYPYPQRRTLYGRAGEYRYGKTLEYRVPEVLMGAHPATWNLLWDLGRHAAWLGIHGLAFLWDAEDDEVRDTINKGDVRQAQVMLKRNEKLLRTMLKNIYYYMDEPRYALSLRVLHDGIGTIVANPTNIEKNWMLDGTWKAHNGNPNTTWGSVMYSSITNPNIKV